MKRSLLLAAICALAAAAQAAAPITVNRALVSKLPERSRRALFATDPVEALIVAGKPFKPAAGAPIGASAESGTWTEITADSLGWFGGPALRGAWICVGLPRPSAGIWLLEAMGNSMSYVNGEPRIGNTYRGKENFEAWEPRFDYGLIPVALKAGENQLLFRAGRGRFKLLLHPAEKSVLFNARDLTLPDGRCGEMLQSHGAIPVLNATAAPMRGLFLRGRGPGVTIAETPLPELLPLGMRKVAFPITMEAADTPGDLPVTLTLVRKSAGEESLLDETTITLRRQPQGSTYKCTFISEIDGSVQYYAVNPAQESAAHHAAAAPWKAVNEQASGAILPAVAGTAAGQTAAGQTAAGKAAAGQRAARQTTATQSAPGDASAGLIPSETRTDTGTSALFFSLHGANVEALNQAGSYAPKSWGHIVAPTNRRPYGHNWEDWGRMDALEVLARARQSLDIDSSRIYLTGHSMGGHGTWQIGGTFPDQFAAIGPSAGWISFWSYRVREQAGDSSAVEKMLRRAANPSQTFQLAENYQQHGVYIIHGSDDDNVRVDQAHQMVERIKPFHKDWQFHEQQGAGHWWDLSDEPGADCVDWPPLFDFFARHARPGAERIRRVDFITANPGLSSRSNWLTIAAQEHPLAFSRAIVQFDPGGRRFHGTTENVALLGLEDVQGSGDALYTVMLDSQEVRITGGPRLWLEKHQGLWRQADGVRLSDKGPHRYGPFKEALQQRLIFVYGTRGSAAENLWALQKARFDAETFWYQANGSIDVVADVDFDPAASVDRSVVLYGNARSNSAWKKLLAGSPVEVEPGRVTIGARRIQGDNLAVLFIRPRPGSDRACVAAVSGTGLAGMRLTNNLPYLYAGYAFPDVTVLDTSLLSRPNAGLVAAGFFNNQWGLDGADMAFAGE